MSDMTTWRARRTALGVLLDEPDAAENRDQLKADIIALYKAVEAHITEVSALRDDIKGLIDKWKTLQAPSSEPEFSVERPARPTTERTPVVASSRG